MCLYHFISGVVINIVISHFGPSQDLLITKLSHSVISDNRKVILTKSKDTVVASKFSDKYGSIMINDALLSDSTSAVVTPPSAFRFNTFYQKYLNAAGIPIIGSSKVSDDAFYRTRKIVLMMLSKVPSLKLTLIKNNSRIAIIGSKELTNDLPEYSDIDDYINSRARGLGGNKEFPLTSCAEENILCFENDRYKGEDILIHEFAHTIHEIGLNTLVPKFSEKLDKIYHAAISKGLWERTYASSSASEYFAEGVQSWFNVNKNEQTPNGIHNDVCTQAKLRKYDPALYDLIASNFPDPVYGRSCHWTVGFSKWETFWRFR